MKPSGASFQTPQPTEGLPYQGPQIAAGDQIKNRFLHEKIFLFFFFLFHTGLPLCKYLTNTYYYFLSTCWHDSTYRLVLQLPFFRPSFPWFFFSLFLLLPTYTARLMLSTHGHEGRLPSVAKPFVGTILCTFTSKVTKKWEFSAQMYFR